ncbi:MAG: sulfatase-like hydrolase/transferase [Verrucomicrobia bacterium]|nr:sulfatase-like hydrolase/transferase [Verrucomicrobiota bacterium]
MASIPHLVFGLALAATSLGAAERPRPNVLFVAIDDLRNDLGALGASHAKTPQLDAFAATARVFTHHYAQVPTCGASSEPQLELFDYATDPDETRNPAAERPEIVRDLKAQLARLPEIAPAPSQAQKKAKTSRIN